MSMMRTISAMGRIDGVIACLGIILIRSANDLLKTASCVIKVMKGKE